MSLIIIVLGCQANKAVETSLAINYRDVGNKAFTGTFNNNYPIVHLLGEDTILVEPEKANYIFIGWFLDPLGLGNQTTRLRSGDEFSSDITLFAKWQFANVIEISSVEDLDNIRNNLTGVFSLVNNIDLGGKEWLPIGTEESSFEGIFIGNNFTISNLTMPSNNQEHSGLFGYARNATFRNIRLHIDFSITRNSDYRKDFFVGGLVGRIEGENTFINCHVSGNVKALSLGSASILIGGLVGAGGRYSTSIKIMESHAAVNIFSDFEESSGIVDAGGLVSSSHGSIRFREEVYTVDISDSSNSGNFTLYRGDAGGLIRNIGSDSSIINSFNSGKISVKNGIVGGLAISGSNVQIIDSFNANNLSARGSVGGLINYLSGDESRIINSYNTGDIESESETGGLVSLMSSGLILNSFNTGNITISNATTVRAGGIAGRLIHVTVVNSYNSGKIDATGVNLVAAGGLIGDAFISSINASFNSGDVTAIATARWDSDSYAGGLVGLHRDNTSEGYIINSFNSGNIEANSPHNLSNSNAGGLVGLAVELIVKNSFNVGSVTSNNFASGFVGTAIVVYIENGLSLGNVVGHVRDAFIARINRHHNNSVRAVNSYFYNTMPNNLNLGTTIQIEDLNKLFFLETLLWDADIWNFNDFNFQSGLLPSFFWQTAKL